MSHDRYFMDKIVDHLLVFRGEGNIKDFPGNYSQYREWENDRLEQERAAVRDTPANSGNNTGQRVRLNDKRRLTFKEKRELEQLTSDIDALEKEKADIIAALSSGSISIEDINTLSKRLPVLNEELDEKSMRWLELSEYDN